MPELAVKVLVGRAVTIEAARRAGRKDYRRSSDRNRSAKSASCSGVLLLIVT